jgi:hypothetical protein
MRARPNNENPVLMGLLNKLPKCYISVPLLFKGGKRQKQPRKLAPRASPPSGVAVAPDPGSSRGLPLRGVLH